MAKKKKTKRTKTKINTNSWLAFGQWSFLFGIFLAIIAGIFVPNNMVIAWILIIFGFIVGILNITTREMVPFLVASIALMLSAGVFGALPFVGFYIKAMLDYIIEFVAPAAAFIALVVIFNLEETR